MFEKAKAFIVTNQKSLLIGAAVVAALALGYTALKRKK